MTVAVIAGAVILFPSLALLFRLVLHGQLNHTARVGERTPSSAASLLAVSLSGSRARFAAASLVAGFGFLTVAEAGWAHAVGVLALLGFLVLGFLAAAPSQLAAGDRDGGTP